jgi:hypothetical protein
MLIQRCLNECWLIALLNDVYLAQDSLVFRVLNIAVYELLNFRVQGSESLVSFSVWVVNTHICSRRNDVKFGIKNINAVDDTVKPRKSECDVGLILPDSVLAAKTTQQKSDIL